MYKNFDKMKLIMFDPDERSKASQHSQAKDSSMRRNNSMNILSGKNSINLDGNQKSVGNSPVP